MDETYNHPKLGTMLPEDTDWIVRASVPFASRPIEVCLAGEDEGIAPSSDSLAGYDWISAHWPRVLDLIADQAFDFYEPYRDAVASVPKFESPGAMWGTEVLSSVRVRSKDDFEVSLRFAWQEEDDPHVITFYVEDGRCRTHSVDG